MTKYTSLEKAMIGVRTNKEVEECHKDVNSLIKNK